MATLSFCIMDAPYENARSTTALRLIDAALHKGHNVNVFAYEGAVALPYTRQAPHPNPAHDRTAEEEDHPLPKEWISALFALATEKGVTLDWVNCGLCVDERGVPEAVEGVRRGGPKHFWEFIENSDTTLCIPTKS